MRRVAIAGGGASGALLTVHLLRFARGRTWESTAVPDIREQARSLAAAWVAQLG